MSTDTTTTDVEENWHATVTVRHNGGLTDEQCEQLTRLLPGFGMSAYGRWPDQLDLSFDLAAADLHEATVAAIGWALQAYVAAVGDLPDDHVLGVSALKYPAHAARLCLDVTKPPCGVASYSPESG